MLGGNQMSARQWEDICEYAAGSNYFNTEIDSQNEFKIADNQLIAGPTGNAADERPIVHAGGLYVAPEEQLNVGGTTPDPDVQQTSAVDEQQAAPVFVKDPPTSPDTQPDSGSSPTGANTVDTAPAVVTTDGTRDKPVELSSDDSKTPAPGLFSRAISAVGSGVKYLRGDAPAKASVALPAGAEIDKDVETADSGAASEDESASDKTYGTAASLSDSESPLNTPRVKPTDSELEAETNAGLAAIQNNPTDSDLERETQAGMSAAAELIDNPPPAAQSSQTEASSSSSGGAAFQQHTMEALLAEEEKQRNQTPDNSLNSEAELEAYANGKSWQKPKSGKPLDLREKKAPGWPTAFPKNLALLDYDELKLLQADLKKVHPSQRKHLEVLYNNVAEQIARDGPQPDAYRSISETTSEKNPPAATPTKLAAQSDNSSNRATRSRQDK
jgi:hypothetical protein